MVLHHVSLGTNDLTRAKAFYDPLMAELGLRVIKETERIIAYGLTETVFSLKGVGWYAAQSVGDLDLPPIMGVTLYGAFFIVVFSALVDFLYAFLDPRIRPT